MDEGKMVVLFVWEDGFLIKVMCDGDILFVDEFLFVEDFVFECLNFVFEFGRSITFFEKGGVEVEEFVVYLNFLIFGMMNFGGDFGKKEFLFVF